MQKTTKSLNSIQHSFAKKTLLSGFIFVISLFTVTSTAFAGPQPQTELPPNDQPTTGNNGHTTSNSPKCDDSSIPDEVKAAAGCSGNSDDLPHTIIGIINAVIGVLGLVAVIVIIYAGVQYMTSSGDSGKTKKAKDTLLYAVIGLIVCVLAFAIVNFVVANFLGN